MLLTLPVAASRSWNALSSALSVLFSWVNMVFIGHGEVSCSLIRKWMGIGVDDLRTRSAICAFGSELDMTDGVVVAYHSRAGGFGAVDNRFHARRHLFDGAQAHA